MSILLSVALALFAGLMVTRIFKLFKLNFPDVTAFLIAGLLIGPYAIGRLGIPGIGFDSYASVESVSIISKAALGFIAFAIGNEFRLSQLKHTGRQALVIGIFQAVTATLVVDAVLLGIYFIFGKDVITPPIAITLGAIAAATAPAATLMVVRQYKAKGPLTDLLLPIVALDDAVGLVLFAISFGIAQALIGGSISFVTVIINPIIEIISSLILGSVMGWLLTKMEKLFFSNSNRLSMTIAFVLVTIALSSLTFTFGEVKIGFSSLLVCMMLGTIFCNLCHFSEDLMSRADKWTAPLFALFFVLSGAELELSVFSDISVIIIGLVYILFRSLGKYFGAYFSSKWTRCSRNVQNHLGITLLPQAGVALGMCVTASTLGTHEGMMIRNIVLFGVFIYELIGPMMTKWSLEKAGEIGPVDPEKLDHNRFVNK